MVFRCDCVTLKEISMLDGHQQEHGNTGPNMPNAIDGGEASGVMVGRSAPGASRPECVSYPDIDGLFKPATEKRGGARAGSGPKPRPPSVAVVAPSAGGPRWYCVEAHARAEAFAVGQMIAQGFQAFVPLHLVQARTRPGEARQMRQAPAFPGYVLCEFDARVDPWRRLASARGVKRLMGWDAERPAPLPIGEAAWIIAQFGPAGVQLIPSPVPPAGAEPLALGQWVRIVAGPFRGYEGRVRSSDGREVALVVAGVVMRMVQAAVEVSA